MNSEIRALYNVFVEQYDKFEENCRKTKDEVKPMLMQKLVQQTVEKYLCSFVDLTCKTGESGQKLWEQNEKTRWKKLN